MKKKEFVSSVVSLSLSMLIIQAASMGFSVYVSSRLGAVQMGAYHLIMSVYSFALTAAFSGVPSAAARLVSEASTQKEKHSYVKSCLKIGACFGLASGCVAFLAAEKICARMLKVPEAAQCVRILALSLPFSSLSAAVRGYFTGIRRVSCITVGRMTEDFSFMFTITVLMKIYGTVGTGIKILSVATAVSAVCAFTADLAMYGANAKNARDKCGTARAVLRISAPIGAGSYLRSLLVTAENLLIPSALAKHGSASPMASYGTVKAMALPVITFPYVFLQSFTSLLMPEISSRNARNCKNGVDRAAAVSLKFTLAFSAVTSGVLLIFGKRLGLALYGDASVGKHITALALLAVPMYIDTVTDSILKGLDCQVYCLKINIIDSALRVPMIYFLLPHTGIGGYIAVLYVSELINLAFSMKKLISERKQKSTCTIRKHML